MLHTIERRPGGEFSGIIEKFWLLPRNGGDRRWLFESPPDGNFDLVFVLSEKCCKVLYVGPFTRVQRIPMLDRCEYFCVLFRPGIMPRVGDVAAAELVNTWAELPKVLGVSIDELGERLSNARDVDAKKSLMENFFRKAGLEAVMPAGLYVRAVEFIESSGGRIRVDKLSEILGVTTRTLERMFREQAGVPPKQFIRLVRFQNVLSRLRSRTSFTNLADLASEWGYADQSHFIRDFKTLSQRLPSAL